MKEQVYRTQGTNLSDAVNTAFDEMFDSLDSADFQEGVAHFVENAPPLFLENRGDLAEFLIFLLHVGVQRPLYP